MSNVTNCILVISGLEMESERIQDVMAFFSDREEPMPPFKSIHDESLPQHWYGGNKGFEAQMYIAAFNHLNEPAFLIHLFKVVKWRCPEWVQLIIQREDEFLFSILTRENVDKEWPMFRGENRINECQK